MSPCMAVLLSSKRSSYLDFNIWGNRATAVDEASAILGAGPVRTFWSITLPLSLPGVVAGVVLVFSMSMSFLRDAGPPRRRQRADAAGGRLR
ncbi:ABC transporter permease subunit [Hydrogenibacillus schlegelii]|uniref:ABC transporter permease subunit n=1 Tax=Hydrogenibacillus schlegelii TaxID=1484 RepID=UPI003C6D8BC8